MHDASTSPNNRCADQFRRVAVDGVVGWHGRRVPQHGRSMLVPTCATMRIAWKGARTKPMAKKAAAFGGNMQRLKRF
jgi:hypothetical protein